MKISYSLTIKNKKYTYTLEKIDPESTYIICEAAGIDQGFLNEDLAEFLLHLPEYILEKEERKKNEDRIAFRVTTEQKKAIQKKAFQKGHRSVSNFLKELALKA